MSYVREKLRQDLVIQRQHIQQAETDIAKHEAIIEERRAKLSDASAKAEEIERTLALIEPPATEEKAAA